MIKTEKLASWDGWLHTCQTCGFVWTDAKEEPEHRCQPRFCKHLGEDTGEHATVTCQCNGQTTQRTYDVYQCAVMGLTLPAYLCTKDATSEAMDRTIAVCQGCQRFEKRGT